MHLKPTLVSEKPFFAGIIRNSLRFVNEFL